MISTFLKGGPMMWPLLLTSLTALTVVFERLIFTIRERMNRQPRVVAAIFSAVQRGDMEGALAAGEGSNDFLIQMQSALWISTTAVGRPLGEW